MKAVFSMTILLLTNSMVFGILERVGAIAVVRSGTDA